MSGHFRTFVVINPRSQAGTTESRWSVLSEALRAAVGDFHAERTNGPGHASDLVRSALRDGYGMIVAIGGDGTFHEVVNGFFEGEAPVTPSPVLGLIPSGTGGDYRRTWGLDEDPLAAIARLAGRVTRPADAGRIRWHEPDGSEHLRYFINIASFGVSAEVSRLVNAGTKRLGGRASFFLASLRAGLGYRRPAVRLTVDDDAPRDLSVNFVACALGRYFGGGMMVAPEADPGDGLLDVVAVSGLGKIGMMRMTSMYRGGHLGHPAVLFSRGRAVDAGCDAGPCFIEADGEVFGRLPARFEVVPGAFRVKV